MSVRSRFLGLVGAIASLLFLAGCGSSDDDTTVPSAKETPQKDDMLCQSPDKSAASERIEGLSIEKAEDILQPTECTLRLVEVDGRSFAVTWDMVGTRINVVVRDGVIVRIDGLY